MEFLKDAKYLVRDTHGNLFRGYYEGKNVEGRHSFILPNIGRIVEKTEDELVSVDYIK